MILVPLFDLKFPNVLAATDLGTSNRQHSRRQTRSDPISRSATVTEQQIVATAPVEWPRSAGCMTIELGKLDQR